MCTFSNVVTIAHNCVHFRGGRGLWSQWNWKRYGNIFVTLLEILMGDDGDGGDDCDGGNDYHHKVNSL